MGREKEFENTTSEFGFRKYDEETGSFLQPDPLWALFPSQSPYQYGYNSPLNFSDASGLFNETPLTGSPTVSVCQGCGADGVTGGCVCGGGGGTGGGGTSGGGTGGIGINPYFEAIAAANQASREAGWASASREFFAADNLALAASAGRIPGGSGGGNANNNDTGQRGSTPNDVVSMLDGQNRTQTQTPNQGSGEYGGRVRSDGSVWFSKSHKAFRYMYNVQKNGREAFGVIFKNGVLVLPIVNNTVSNSAPERSGYSVSKGRLTDPIGEYNQPYVTTIHTHPEEADPRVTGWKDYAYLGHHNPGNWWIVMGIESNSIYAFGTSCKDCKGVMARITNDNGLTATDILTPKGAAMLMQIFYNLQKY